MITLQDRASELLRQFKGDNYAFGLDVLDETGPLAASLGRCALVITGSSAEATDKVTASLQQNGVALAGGRVVSGARPNAPQEDVYRLQGHILHCKPDCVVVIGGGSGIDAAKAAIVLASLGSYSPEIETYFGTNRVTEVLDETGRALMPLLAVETASSSGAHLTKYSNVTDPEAGQKKLIVDEAIVPPKAVFDYALTTTMPAELTADGAVDGMAHCLEVFYGIQEPNFQLCQEITEVALGLILKYTKQALDAPDDLQAREALGLATDLGGYAIMVGGTNGAHLTSFSLIDAASHGRACGLMNPYYTVFFAPAIEEQLRVVGSAFAEAGFISEDLTALRGTELGLAVARGMVAFHKSIGLPTTLNELQGFSEAHIERALTAAKNPQLEMKLKNMPIPLHAGLVDEYMRPLLLAAKSGNFSEIKEFRG